MTRDEAERLFRGSDGKRCQHDYLKRECIAVGVLGESYFCLGCGKEEKLMDSTAVRDTNASVSDSPSPRPSPSES